MNHRQSYRAHYRATEETTGQARDEINDWFTQGGEDFWHSVWKRIEGEQPRSAGGPRRRRVAPEAPRDYVVDCEARV